MTRYKKRKSSHLNKTVLVFVCTLLITIILGLVFIGIISAGNCNSSADNKNGDEALDKENRIPFSEKILTDQNGGESGDLASENGDGFAEESDGIADGNGTETEGEDSDSEEAELSEESYESEPESFWNHNITAAGDDCVTLSFAGDILFDPNYAIMNRIRQNGGAISGVIGDSLLGYLRGADIAVVNNEFPYSNGGSPLEEKTFTFRAEPSSASLLNDMGVDLVTLANNHAYDYGPGALLDSITALDNVSVAHAGAGANIDDAAHPVYYTAQNGIKIAIIAATQIERFDNPDTKGATADSPGVFRCLDITRLQNEIKKAKDTGAFVIVCIHWGTENMEEIDWWQEKQGPEIVQAGADLIIGCHPHILQKIGYIDGVPVAYSLGNFLFNSKRVETALVNATVYADKSVKLKFVPAVQEGCNVNEAQGDDRAVILSHMREISQGVSIDEDGNIQ